MGKDVSQAMSDFALLRTSRIFLCVAIVAALAGPAVGIIGLGELLAALIVGAALACAFGWWWFGHCLEVRRIAESFRDPNSRKVRDLER